MDVWGDRMAVWSVVLSRGLYSKRDGRQEKPDTNCFFFAAEDPNESDEPKETTTVIQGHGPPKRTPTSQ